jgi:hypothetical protein
MKIDTLVSCIPTIGFNVETIQIENHDYVIWDVGG